MPTRQETTLERRRRQLEVIGKKCQRAIDQKDEAALLVHKATYEQTEKDIAALEGEAQEAPTPRRSRRES